MRKALHRVPLYVTILFLCVLWITPTVGLLVTSFRPQQAVTDSGWWTVFAPRQNTGQAEYQQYCASCHGNDGTKVTAANLTDPKLIEQYRRSISLTAALKKPLRPDCVDIL